MRVVLDTNVFISGIFWEGNFCSMIIQLWKNRKFDLVVSIPIVEELIKTLRTFKIQMDDEMIRGWQNIILENSILVEPEEIEDIFINDENDKKFIESAVSGKADFIVSQDKHLLDLKECQGIRIISPEEFVRMV